jgi:hypothetical protein
MKMKYHPRIHSKDSQYLRGEELVGALHFGRHEMFLVGKSVAA